MNKKVFILHKVAEPKKTVNGVGDSELARVADILENAGLKYWLACGTLLGIYRDGKLISSDTDLDFEVYLEGQDTPDVLNACGEMVRIMRDIKTKTTFQKVYQHKEGADILIDFYFYRYHPKGIITFSEACGEVGYPHRFLENLTTVEYKGRKYPCFPPDEYLDFMFGKNWRVPSSEPGTWCGWSLE